MTRQRPSRLVVVRPSTFWIVTFCCAFAVAAARRATASERRSLNLTRVTPVWLSCGTVHGFRFESRAESVTSPSTLARSTLDLLPSRHSGSSVGVSRRGAEEAEAQRKEEDSIITL